MDRTEISKTHVELDLAGFRALATAAGLLQLTRELKATGLIDDAAVARIREAMLCELLENVPRPLVGDRDYERRLRCRLEALFAGTAHLSRSRTAPPGG